MDLPLTFRVVSVMMTGRDPADPFEGDDRAEFALTEVMGLPCPACGRPGFHQGVCAGCGFKASLPDADDEVTEDSPSEVLTRPELDEAIAALELELPEVKEPAPEARDAPGYAACPRCSHASTGSRRCPQCGYPLRFDRKRSANREPRRCRNCGVRNAPSEPVCINCGNRFAPLDRD